MHRVIEKVLEFRDNYHRESFKLFDRIEETHVVKVSHRTFHELRRDCNPAIDSFFQFTRDLSGFTITGIPLIVEDNVDDVIIEKRLHGS